MAGLLFSMILFCGLVLPSVRPLPVLWNELGDMRTADSSSPTDSIRKRSTNADIGLNGSRMANMQELLRRYMLLTILENVKGKRSWMRRNDESPNYEHMAGVILRNRASKQPWYVVDMKRDIHSESEPGPVPQHVFATNAAKTLQTGNRPRATDESSNEDTLDRDLGFLSHNFPYILNGEKVNIHNETPDDEANGNAEMNLLDLLSM